MSELPPGKSPSAHCGHTWCLWSFACFLEVLHELDTRLCVNNPLHYSNRKVYYDDQILKFGT